jgi:hypothetical protein
MVLRKDKLPTLCQISTKPNTFRSGEEGYTSVVDDGVWGKTCIKFEECIKYLCNASNKQYTSLPIGRGAQRGGGSLGDQRGWGAQRGEDLLTTYA